MNDHAGWTKDLKCVLCGSDDSSKPCGGLKEEYTCNGVVPGTFVLCGEDDYQYCSDECEKAANKIKINGK